MWIIAGLVMIIIGLVLVVWRFELTIEHMFGRALGGAFIGLIGIVVLLVSVGHGDTLPF